VKFFFLSFLLISTLFSDELHWFHRYDEAIDASAKYDKPVMLYITMRGCHACEMMKKSVFTEKEIQMYLQDNFILLQVDIKNRRIPEKFRAFVTPTFEFINSNEESIVDTVRGGKKAWKFLEILEDVVEEASQNNS